MKRLIYLSLAALMVLAVSCKKAPKVGTLCTPRATKGRNHKGRK